nr:AlNc14C308G10473 [Albugo laibachii Nc14]|eukprot:CCA25627.1 AlNc14C308G10473 [Albugo laibachii Nc14]
MCAAHYHVLPRLSYAALLHMNDDDPDMTKGTKCKLNLKIDEKCEFKQNVIKR